MIELANKEVFIIGAAIENRFAAEGANVIFNYAKPAVRENILQALT